MKKIYQRIIDAKHGDCMQAAIASLFDDEYENVPAFIEYEISIMERMFDQYIESKGYVVNGMLHNKMWNTLLHPTDECWKKPRFLEKGLLKPENLSTGVDGYFYCSVLSPKYFSWGHMGTHAVICDSNLNIVHDPNKEYEGLKSYPLASVIGCNGIIGLYDIVKKP